MMVAILDRSAKPLSPFSGGLVLVIKHEIIRIQLFYFQAQIFNRLTTHIHERV